VSPARIEVLVWVLIYGGLLAVGLGVVVARSEPGLGIGIAITGGIVAAIGVVLIVVRSRMKT
jgi:hypothetical protein